MHKLNHEPYRRNWIEIIGSLHGLVCISPCKGAVFLYNPTTRESKRFPEKITEKVVKLVVDGDHVLNASVYLLNSDSLRWIRDLSYEHKDNYNSAVSLKGVWSYHLVLKQRRFERCYCQAEDCSHSYRKFLVWDLSGRLCVVNSWYEVHDDVWVMNEYGVVSSWSRIRISFLFRSMKPLGSSKNTEKILLELDGAFFETHASRYLGIRGVKLGDGFEADTYVESLISPNSYGAEN
ncbi:hypothetical protein Bca4012_010949 [Brassica carinata]